MNKFIKEKISSIIVLVVIVIAFGASLAIMLKYKTEGEKTMPFEISKILIVSSAEASNKEENPDNQKWNFNISQYNDVYITIEKNEKYQKNAYINSIELDNISIESSNKDKVILYKPCEDEEKMFSYEDKYIFNNSIEYKGEAVDNLKKLEISNSGGTLLFRVYNKNIGEYVSNEDDEIHYDGSLLKKAGIKLADLKTKISFDVVIETNNSTYRGKIEIEVPNENTDEEGVTQKTIENFDDIIFKRERKD